MITQMIDPNGWIWVSQRDKRLRLPVIGWNDDSNMAKPLPYLLVAGVISTPREPGHLHYGPAEWAGMVGEP
jgi:hypothetical protein